ncbi:MAG: hypothetical protein KDD66_15630 [Bdellovibrionales bacterium]|nr:hypothetical protein [Bdellovibrionales bacterium]
MFCLLFSALTISPIGTQSAEALSLRSGGGGGSGELPEETCLSVGDGYSLVFNSSNGTVRLVGPNGRTVGSANYVEEMCGGVPCLTITYGGSWLFGIPAITIAVVGNDYREIIIGDYLFIDRGSRTDVYISDGRGGYSLVAMEDVPKDIRNIFDTILNYMARITACTGLKLFD